MAVYYLIRAITTISNCHHRCGPSSYRVFTCTGCFISVHRCSSVDRVFTGYLQGVSLSCTQLFLMASPAVWCVAVYQCYSKRDDDKHVSTLATLHTATYTHIAWRWETQPHTQKWQNEHRFFNTQDDPALQKLAFSGTFPLWIKTDFGRRWFTYLLYLD